MKNSLSRETQLHILHRGSPHHLTKMIRNTQLHPEVMFDIAMENGNANQNHISDLIDHQNVHDFPMDKNSGIGPDTIQRRIVASGRSNAEKLRQKHPLRTAARLNYEGFMNLNDDWWHKR